MKNRFRFLSTVGLATAICNINVALAQDDQPQRSRSGAASLEEVVVTARRTEETLQEVPLAVTALSGQMLSDQNVLRQEDLVYVTPGLSVNQVGDAGLTFSLRGQGQIFGGSAPGVQTYFDEVPLIQGQFEMFDIERIEVLRGPQGTLFGRNTTGGAVRIVPRKATASGEFGGYVNTSLGNYSYREHEAAVAIPVIRDVLGLRIAGNITERDGYVEDLSTGKDRQDLDNQNLRISAAFVPTEIFENQLIYNYYSADSYGTGYVIGMAPPPALAPVLGPAYELGRSSDFLRMRSNPALEPKNDVTSETIQNIAVLDFENVALRYVFGHTETERSLSYDLDGTALPLLELVDQQIDDEATTHEVQMLGNAGDLLEWIVGAYYEDSSSDRISPSVISGNPQLSAGRIESTSKALFAQGTWDLASWVEGISLVSGYRHTWDERSARTGASLPLTGPERSADFESSSWTLGVNYQLTPDTLVYVATRKGYKAGGFNPTAVAGVPFLYEPEELHDVEVGLKQSWYTDVMTGTLNIAAYRGDFSEIQRFTTATVNDRLQTYTFNAGDAVVKGAEVEATLRFYDALDLSAIYAYTDASFDEYRDPTSGLDFIATGQISDFAYTPENKLTLSARYHLPISASYGDASVGVTWYRQSKNALAEPNSIYQPAYELINANISWNSVMGSPLDMTLFGKNLADERYFTGLGFRNFGLVTVGEPRMFGLQVTYRFGIDASGG